MNSTQNSANGRHKSAKASRRARKRRKSSASTLSKSSKSDVDRPVTKTSPVPVAEATLTPSSVTSLSAQPSPTSSKKPEDAAPAESAELVTAFTEFRAVPSAHLAFDNSLLVEEPVVVASPLSPLVIPAKTPSIRQSLVAETGSVAPHPKPSFGVSAAAAEADDAHHRIFTGLQARLRSSDAALAAVSAQVPYASRTRKPSCGQLVLTALPHVLLAVFALAAVFAAVTLLTPESRPLDVCRSHTCVEYSGRLRRSVNLLISPCVSLTRFVCAGWPTHDELGVRAGVVEAALGRMSRLALTVDGSSSRPQSGAQSGAMFFRSCIAVFRGERDELENATRALAEAGVTWPHRPPDKPDVLHTLLFTAIRLGWPAILRVDILEGSGHESSTPSGPEQHTIALTPSREFRMLARKHASLPEAPASRNAYFTLLRDSFGSDTDEAVTFDATEELDAKFFVPLAAVLRTSRPRPEHLEAGALFSGALVPESRWRSVLAAYGLSSQEGQRLLVRSEHVDFVRAFIDVWEAVGEADTHLFLSWCTVQLAALLARRSLIVSFYGSHRGAQLMHGAFCLARTYQLFGDATFAGYSADVLYASSRRQAEALATMVRQQFRSNVVQWLQRNENVTIVADWNSMDVMFRVVAAAIREAGGGFTHHIQLQYPDIGDSVVTNWLNAAAAGRTMVSPSRESILTALEALSFHAEVDNDFALLPYAFSFPLYDADAMLAINYAGLGGQVAQALGELFLKAYRDSTFQIMESISQFTKCLGLNNVTSPHAEAQALQVLSFSVLFDAYRAAAEAGDRRLVGFEQLTPAQLFFVAACYARCPGGASSTYPLSASPLVDAAPEPDCDALFQRSGHFARAFGCDLHAPVNAGDECKLPPLPH